MRILFVYYIYPDIFGGVSTVVYKTAKELVKRGHFLTVLTTNAYTNYPKGYYREGNISLYRCSIFLKTINETKNCFMWSRNIILDQENVTPI